MHIHLWGGGAGLISYYCKACWALWDGTPEWGHALPIWLCDLELWQTCFERSWVKSSGTDSWNLRSPSPTRSAGFLWGTSPTDFLLLAAPCSRLGLPISSQLHPVFILTSPKPSLPQRTPRSFRVPRELGLRNSCHFLGNRMCPVLGSNTNSRICRAVVTVVSSRSHVWLSATPRPAACQAPLSSTVTWNLRRLMSIELMMPSDHLNLCCPLLLLPQPFPASGSFSMSQLFTSCSQSIGASGSVSVLPLSIQDWFPSELTDLTSLLSL